MRLLFASVWAVLTLSPWCLWAGKKAPLRAVLVLKTAPVMYEGASNVLKGHLSDLAVDLSVESPDQIPSVFDDLYNYFTSLAAERDAEVVFMTDFETPERATLYISLPETGTTLVRHVDCTDQSDFGRYEVVAVIVRGILAAMSTGGEIGVHIPEVPVEEPVSKTAEPVDNGADEDEAAPPSEAVENKGRESGRPSVTFGGRVGYALGNASRSVPIVHNARLAFSAIYKQFRINLAYRAAVPFGKEDDNVSLTLHPHPVSFGFGYGVTFSQSVFIIGLEGVLDPVRWSAVSKNSTSTKGFERRSVRFALSPSVSMNWSLMSRLSVYVAFSLDIYLYQSAFYVTVDDEKRDFLSLWTFCPLFQIGVGFGLT